MSDGISFTYLTQFVLHLLQLRKTSIKIQNGLNVLKHKIPLNI